MKINFNINLTKKQQEAYDILHQNDCQYLVARWSRQCGKTVLAEIMLIEYLCKRGKFNAYISPSYSQGRKVFKEITALLGDTGIVKKANASTLTIETIYDSTLQFFSMESPTSIRGYTVSGILVMDEASFFPDMLPDGSEPWSSIIMPITKARKPKTLIISTPKGKRGMFHNFYLKAIEGQEGYKEITATIYDDELISKDDIEAIRDSISPTAFKEEFLVEFLDSSLTFFEGFEGCFSAYAYNDSIRQWGGLDISANGDDETILTFINEMNQIRQYKIEGTLDMKYKRIADILNSTKGLQYCLMENNGVGAPIINEIRKLVARKNKIVEWNTSNSSKEEIISKLAVDISNKALKFNRDDGELFSQFSTFICKYTKTGKMQFEAQAGHKDDRIMSLAIANRCKDSYASAGGNIAFSRLPLRILR